MSESPSNNRTGSRDVMISAGHSNFHLIFTASEMDRQQRLFSMMTGAYPRSFEISLLSLPGLKRIARLQRFIARQDKIDLALVRQSRTSQLMQALGARLSRYFNDDELKCLAFRAYARRAHRFVREAAQAEARIYHFRAGFGQGSVQEAQRMGMWALCDHSIVHPALIDVLVQNKGRFPDSRPPRPEGFWGMVLDDIEQADHVVLNSDFVAETFAFMGFDMSRTSVVYQGVEDKFFARLPTERSWRVAGEGPLRLLFAGSVTPRKGVDLIQQMLAANPGFDIELSIAGGLAPADAVRFAGLIGDPRVRYLGLLSQAELAERMVQTDVFLFPTLAEGSARVVFEAMAAGCAVITTPNAGSVVDDRQGGRLVPPGDAAALALALDGMALDRQRIAVMGRHNAARIAGQYRQKNYGEALLRAYEISQKSQLMKSQMTEAKGRP